MSNNIVKCTICDNEYNSYFSMWRHRKTKHENVDTNEIEVVPTIFQCKYCNKELANKHSLLRHENTACKKNPELVKNITNINVNDNNNSNINVIQNQTNITINFNSLGNENILDLTEKQKEEIINDGIDGIITLIKHLNFNKDIPQNHLFCTVKCQT